MIGPDTARAIAELLDRLTLAETELGLHLYWTGDVWVDDDDNGSLIKLTRDGENGYGVVAE